MTNCLFRPYSTIVISLDLAAVRGGSFDPQRIRKIFIRKRFILPPSNFQRKFPIQIRFQNEISLDFAGIRGGLLSRKGDKTFLFGNGTLFHDQIFRENPLSRPYFSTKITLDFTAVSTPTEFEKCLFGTGTQFHNQTFRENSTRPDSTNKISLDFAGVRGGRLALKRYKRFLFGNGTEFRQQAFREHRLSVYFSAVRGSHFYPQRIQEILIRKRYTVPRSNFQGKSPIQTTFQCRNDFGLLGRPWQ